MLLFSFAKNSTHLVRENPKKGGNRMLRGLWFILVGCACAFIGIVDVLAGIAVVKDGAGHITKKGNE